MSETNNCFNQWHEQADERKKEFEKENKKLGCSGIFIVGISAFIWIVLRLMYQL